MSVSPRARACFSPNRGRRQRVEAASRSCLAWKDGGAARNERPYGLNLARRSSTIRSKCDASITISCASSVSWIVAVRCECGFLYDPIAPANRADSASRSARVLCRVAKRPLVRIEGISHHRNADVRGRIAACLADRYFDSAEGVKKLHLRLRRVPDPAKPDRRLTCATGSWERSPPGDSRRTSHRRSALSLSAPSETSRHC